MEDHLHRNFRGSSIRAKQETDGAFDVMLSQGAQEKLHLFRMNDKQGGLTRLDTAIEPVRCVFDARRMKELDGNIELLDPVHPLIRWIVKECEDGLPPHPAVAVSLSAQNAEVERGVYAFVIHRWRFEGLRNDARLVYVARNIRDTLSLDETASERLVGAALFNGEDWPNAQNLIEEPQRLVDAVMDCDNALLESFYEAKDLFTAENDNRCNVQEKEREQVRWKTGRYVSRKN